MRHVHRSRSRGFTIIEMAISVLLLMMLALFTYPAIDKMIVRTKLEGFSQEVAVFLRGARLESIKSGVPVVVEFNGREWRAFTDIHDAGGQQDPDLVFNPQVASPPGETDRVVGLFTVPIWVDMGGPAADPAELVGFTGLPGDEKIVFNPDGRVVDTGALRLGDQRENYLEIAVEPAGSARIQIRKWHRGDNVWYARGSRDSGTIDSTWEWYS